MGRFLNIKEQAKPKKDNTRVKKPFKVKPKTLTKEQSKKLKEEDRLAKKVKQEITPTRKKQPIVKKAYDVLVNPMTSLEQLTKTGKVPDYLNEKVKQGSIERNNLDMAVDVVNPISFGDYLSDIPKTIKEGNYVDAGFRVASVLPMMKAVSRSYLKNTSKVYSKGKDLIINYKDIKSINKFNKEFGYQNTTNIFDIRKTKKIDNAFKKTLGQHNTFTRGVSTNWKHLEKTSPQITNHLKEIGIDYIKNPKEAAEYMATHIPINTGYGRFGARKLEKGQGVLYNSNSHPTGKGYTYGEGYVVDVQKPLDFSSTRKSWINKNNPNYDVMNYNPNSNNTIIKQSYSDIAYTKKQDIALKKLKNKSKEYKINKKDKEINEKLIIENNKEIKEQGKKIHEYQNTRFHRSRVSSDLMFLGENNRHLKNYKDLIKETEEIIKGRSRGFSEDLEALKGYKESIKIINNRIKIFNSPLYKKVEKTLIKQDKLYKKQQEINRKLVDKAYTKVVGINSAPYNHYIFSGKEGEKILNAIKFTKIKEGNAHLSRAHKGEYSEGLSKLEIGGVINTQNTKTKKKPPQEKYLKKKRDSILNTNKHVRFVQRVLDPSLNKGKGITLKKFGEGTISSHSLSTSSDDEGHYVHPEVFDTGKEKFEYKSNENFEAFDYAIKTGNYIKFKTQEEADAFSENYKTEEFKTYDDMKTKKKKLKKVYKKEKGGYVPKGGPGLLAALPSIIQGAQMGLETYSTIDSAKKNKEAMEEKAEMEALQARTSSYTQSTLETDPNKEAGISATGFYGAKGGKVPKAGFGDFMRRLSTPFANTNEKSFGDIMLSIASPFAGERINRDIEEGPGEEEASRIAIRKEKLDAQDAAAPQYYAKGGKLVNNKGKVPKGFAGLIIAGVGLAASAVMTGMKKKKEAEAKAAKEKLDSSTIISQSQLDQQVSNTEGIATEELPTYQAQGGKVNNSQFDTKGGNLKQLSSNTTLAEGKDHSQGGIKLYSKGGEPQAEIENGETIKEENGEAKVYSDQLVVPGTNKTFADISKVLAKQKGKLEKSLEGGGNVIKNNTVKRQTASINRKENELFAAQEQMKQEQGVEQEYVSTDDFAYGGKVPKGNYGFLNDPKKKYTREEQAQIDAGANYQGDYTIGEKSTNISPDTNKGGYNPSVGDIAQGVNIATNLVNTFTKPKVPNPILVNRPILETNVSKNAERAELSNAANNAKRFVKENTSQSKVAVGRNSNINLKAATQANKLTQDELNEERSLRNKNVMLNAQTQTQNAGIVNRYNDQKLNRNLSQRKEVSEAVANTAEYVQRKEQIQKEHDLDREKTNIYANTLDNNGTSGRIEETNVRVGYSKAKSSGNRRMMRLYEQQALELGITLN